MGGGIAQRELQALVRNVRQRQGSAGGGDPRSFSLLLQTLGALLGGSQIGQEDVAPLDDRTSPDVAYIEDGVGELFVKDARLDLGGQLGGDQPAFEPRGIADGERREPDVGGDTDAGGEDGEQHDRRDHAVAGNPGRAHGDDLAIAGEASQTDEDSHQDAKRDAERKDRRQRQAEQLEDQLGRRRIAHQQLEQLACHLLQEDHEGG